MLFTNQNLESLSLLETVNVGAKCETLQTERERKGSKSDIDKTYLSSEVGIHHRLLTELLQSAIVIFKIL